MLGHFRKVKEDSSKAYTDFRIAVKDLDNAAKERTYYTPDMAILEQHKYQLVFIYDEMMLGHPEYDIIKEGSAFAYNAFTAVPYTMFKEKGGKDTRALIIEDPYHNILQRRVSGELHYVEPKQFLKLDEYKENGVQFIRRRETVDVYYSQIKVAPPYPVGQKPQEYRQVYGIDKPKPQLVPVKTSLRAWVYVAVTDFWDKLLDAGYLYSPVNIHVPNRKEIGEYYKFTLKDYSD